VTILKTPPPVSQPILALPVTLPGLPRLDPVNVLETVGVSLLSVVAAAPRLSVASVGGHLALLLTQLGVNPVEDAESTEPFGSAGADETAEAKSSDQEKPTVSGEITVDESSDDEMRRRRLLAEQDDPATADDLIELEPDARRSKIRQRDEAGLDEAFARERHDGQPHGPFLATVQPMDFERWRAATAWQTASVNLVADELIELLAANAVEMAARAADSAANDQTTPLLVSEEPTLVAAVEPYAAFEVAEEEVAAPEAWLVAASQAYQPDQIAGD
jgi:hypothetical protein